jgi:glutaredoxin
MWCWPRRKTAGSRREVVLYTRQGCHLCEQAWELLQTAARRHGLELRQVDVDSDPALLEQYDQCVPVVAIDGKVRFRGVVNAVLLERQLRGRNQNDERA